MVLRGYLVFGNLSGPPNVPPLMALWSLVDGIRGVLKCGWGGAGGPLE